MFQFDLSQDIERYLLSNPKSREFEIVQHLQSIGRIPKNALQQPLSLFRCHFLIFNALYRLQHASHTHQKYQIDISAMMIEVSPYPVLNAALSEFSNTAHNQDINTYSPLALFYTDIQQLNQTQEQDVTKLLSDFWQQLRSPHQMQEAFNTLEIPIQSHTSIDFKYIKKQYRRLIMKHHPDRGGSANKMIAIRQAMLCLEQYYQP